MTAGPDCATVRVRETDRDCRGSGRTIRGWTRSDGESLRIARRGGPARQCGAARRLRRRRRQHRRSSSPGARKPLRLARLIRATPPPASESLQRHIRVSPAAAGRRRRHPRGKPAPPPPRRRRQARPSESFVSRAAVRGAARESDPHRAGARIRVAPGHIHGGCLSRRTS